MGNYLALRLLVLVKQKAVLQKRSAREAPGLSAGVQICYATVAARGPASTNLAPAAEGG